MVRVEGGFYYNPKWYEYSLHPHLVVSSDGKFRHRDGEIEEWGGTLYELFETEGKARDYIASESRSLEEIGRGYTRFDLFRIRVEEDDYEMTPVDEVMIGTE